jgi:hypothetical protein
VDSGWHDDHNPKPLGKSKGKGETGLILSEGARARLEASVSAVVEEGERDANSLARCLHCAKWYPALDKTDGGKGCRYCFSLHHTIASFKAKTKTSDGRFCGAQISVEGAWGRASLQMGCGIVGSQLAKAQIPEHETLQPSPNP